MIRGDILVIVVQNREPFSGIAWRFEVAGSAAVPAAPVPDAAVDSRSSRAVTSGRSGRDGRAPTQASATLPETQEVIAAGKLRFSSRVSRPSPLDRRRCWPPWTKR
jgi:hypothetical protein